MEIRIKTPADTLCPTCKQTVKEGYNDRCPRHKSTFSRRPMQCNGKSLTTKPAVLNGGLQKVFSVRGTKTVMVFDKKIFAAFEKLGASLIVFYR